MTEAFAPTLAANGGGTVANVISVAGLVNFPMGASYSMSKAALHAHTQATRLLLAGQGTRVVGIYPGPVDTEMAAEFDMEKATPQSVAREIVEGLEGEDDYVFPDSMARQMGELYDQNPRALEGQVADMIKEMTGT